MNKKYVLVSLEDSRIKKLADALGNKTCKKVIDFLAEKEATKGEIAKVLKAPLNTIAYNVDKLVEAGLVEKSKNYFWSTKGKKIGVYKISNKSIVISPKISSKVKTILVALGISGLIAALIGIFNPARQEIFTQRMMAEEQVGGKMAEAVPEVLVSILSQPWLWFLIGTIVILIIILILNWKKL